MEERISFAKECGFSEAVELDPRILTPLKAVREACATGSCGAYGSNWTCPPACGSLEECSAAIGRCRQGLLLQTVGSLDDCFDPEGIARTEGLHKNALQRFAERLRREHPQALVLGAGACSICRSCAYPEACRFPEKAVSSMEAYGLLVTQVCRDSGLRYYYGPGTIAFCACVLW